jgi:hypothetical protein
LPRGHLIGSPSGAAFDDWNAPAGARYFYRVSAVTATGQESEPGPFIESPRPALSSELPASPERG